MLPSQETVNEFINQNRHKTGQKLTLEYLKNDVYILAYCFNEIKKWV